MGQCPRTGAKRNLEPGTANPTCVSAAESTGLAEPWSLELRVTPGQGPQKLQPREPKPSPDVTCHSFHPGHLGLTSSPAWTALTDPQTPGEASVLTLGPPAPVRADTLLTLLTCPSSAPTPASSGLCQPLRLLDVVGSLPFLQRGHDFSRGAGGSPYTGGASGTGMSNTGRQSLRLRRGSKYQLIGSQVLRQALHGPEPRTRSPPPRSACAWGNTGAGRGRQGQSEQARRQPAPEPPPFYSRAQLPIKMTARPLACPRSPANLHKMAIYSARLAPTTSSEVSFTLSGNERLSSRWGEATPLVHSSACLARPRLRGPF